MRTVVYIETLKISYDRPNVRKDNTDSDRILLKLKENKSISGPCVLESLAQHTHTHTIYSITHVYLSHFGLRTVEIISNKMS